MTILPSSYLPSIEYFTHLIFDDEVVVDIYEHYIKRSERNRCRIMTAAGVMELTVCVERANSPRQVMRDIKIDYSKRWQHQHSLTILAAYKSSPYYDHYAPFLEPYFKRRYETLVELNSDLTRAIMKLLGVKREVCFTNEYIPVSSQQCDLRPKHREPFVHPEYMQVFYDREPFVGNLSILDLLFNEGPHSLSLLEESRR